MCQRSAADAAGSPFTPIGCRDAEEATEWFVDRLKGVAYSSLECGYFAGFLPLKFLQVPSPLALVVWCGVVWCGVVWCVLVCFMVFSSNMRPFVVLLYCCAA
jgi:hypothetical protein